MSEQSYLLKKKTIYKYIYIYIYTYIYIERERLSSIFRFFRTHAKHFLDMFIYTENYTESDQRIKNINL